MSFWRRISGGLIGANSPFPKGKSGARAYAVGDIHGRLDLLEAIIAQIEADIAGRPPKKNWVIFLGDLIDRGPDSAGVVERLRTWKPKGITPVFLGGNHEEVLLRILEGERGVLSSWLKFGGAECAESYGIDLDALRRMEEATALRLVRAKVPKTHSDFLAGFADTFRFGDYLFVHAGIRPGIAVEDQAQQDLRWIREPFLNDAKEHGFVVVHGHTICEEVEQRPNRIGIDTGAYRSGILTALGIEDEERWFFATDPKVVALRPARSAAA